MNCVFLPAFDPDAAFTHGGILRSRQIRDDLRPLFDVQVVIAGSARRPQLAEVALVLQAVARWRLSPAHAIHYLRFHRALAPHHAAGIRRCFFEHQFGLGRIGAMVALDLGFELTAIPQNLEAFMNWHQLDPITRRRGWNSFTWEIEFFRRMNSVLALSREDTWLLRNLGIAAARYPYWPDAKTETHLAGLRAQRANHPPTGAILVLGSALNAPTIEGMNRLLPRLAGRRCVVVGQGVSRFASSYPAGTLEFHDSVDDATLDRFMVSAPCACIHQDRGSGALTRIRNLLLAGVPVIGSEMAARDYQDEPDVRIYSQFAELPPLVEAAVATPTVATCRAQRPALGAILATAAESRSTRWQSP